MATILASTPQPKVPIQGTMRRCPHGVYIPPNDVTAPYCQACTPGGPADQRDVVLPQIGAALNDNARRFANKHSKDGCPQCGSKIYVRVKENSDGLRQCADCGTKFKVSFTARQRAERVLAGLEV